MNSTSYRYRIHYKANGTDQRILVLTQAPFQKGNEHFLEIPEDDLDNVITKLSNAKDIVDQSPSLETDDFEKEKIDESISQTLIALYFSGVSVSELSQQYNYSEALIKYHLEKKGIIFFD